MKVIEQVKRAARVIPDHIFRRVSGSENTMVTPPDSVYPEVIAEQEEKQVETGNVIPHYVDHQELDSLREALRAERASVLENPEAHKILEFDPYGDISLPTMTNRELAYRVLGTTKKEVDKNDDLREILDWKYMPREKIEPLEASGVNLANEAKITTLSKGQILARANESRLNIK